MKLTRKSYKRKVLTFGAMLMLAVALISTGFAAWIISQGADKNVEGNVEVGIVTDKSVEFENLKFYASCYNPGVDNIASAPLENLTFVTVDKLGESPLRFSFEPKINDKTGYVRSDDKAFEALSIRVTGSIKHAKQLDYISLDFKVTEEILQAATDGYIVLPDYSYSPKEPKKTYNLTAKELQHEGDSDTATFDFTVQIKWGEKFNNTNPSEYFDSQEFADLEGVTKDTIVNEIKAALNELKGVIYGLKPKEDVLDFGDRTYKTYNQDDLDYTKNIPQFKLTITAHAK